MSNPDPAFSNADENVEGSTGGKQVYRQPQLTLYGSVRELTRNGTGSGTDGSGIAGMTKHSDPAYKENAVRIGQHPAGFGIYLFDYKPEFRDRIGRGRQFGVMADEVERIVPEAVMRGPDGYRRVDYAAIGVVPH